MRHGSRKVKIQLGIDANRALMRKLATSFFNHGVLTTTEKRAKLLKSYLERLVEKTKKETESNKNFLLRRLGQPKLVKTLFKSVGPVMAERIGGYVKMEKLYDRMSDGALMIRLEWSAPVVLESTEKTTPEKEIAKEKKVTDAKAK